MNRLLDRPGWVTVATAVGYGIGAYYAVAPEPALLRIAGAALALLAIATFWLAGKIRR